MTKNTTWTNVKAFVQARGLNVQWVQLDQAYCIFASDGPFELSCTIPIDDSPNSDQADFETNFKATGNAKLQRTNAEGVHIQEFALRKSDPGFSNFTIVSHDFTDRTSWYQKSVQVVGETLVDSGDGLTFTSANAHWVNINSPKLTIDYKKILERDGTLSAASKRYVSVTSGGVAKAETITGNPGGATLDYTVNYAAGTITFVASQAGQPVVATYWHNNNVAACSEFLFTPPPGMQYRVEHVEAQFSKNANFTNGIVLEIWAGAVTPPVAPATASSVNLAAYGSFPGYLFDAGYGQSRSIYRNVTDLLNWCTNSYPVTPACGNLTQDILVFPFLYIVHPSVSAKQGTLLRLLLQHDLEISAEICTVTLYMEKGPA